MGDEPDLCSKNKPSTNIVFKTPGGGGGVRFQVSDITLVGGSFFLPKSS